MRHVRYLLPVLILLLVWGVVVSYTSRKALQEKSAPPKPQPLSTDVNATAKSWRYVHQTGSTMQVELMAKQFRQVKDPPRMELDEVELHLYHDQGKVFDLIKSKKADFSIEEGYLYSEGDVEMALGVPADGSPPKRLINVRSSGVRFEIKTGKATTDRPAIFNFDQGDGQATGAEYDPNARELKLWRGKGPNPRMFEIQAGELLYKEKEDKVLLWPWSKLVRGTLTIDAGPADVTLEEGVIRLVDTGKARGVQNEPKRQVDFAAEKLRLQFNEDGETEKIQGDAGSQLVATSPTAKTTMTAQRVDLSFAPGAEDSVLSQAVAWGNSRVESKPIPKPGGQPPETRILTSEVIEMKMRPGGEEIESVVTQTPGRVELIPTRAGQRQRAMDGERIWIAYGPQNQIESFRSVKVTTRTEPDPAAKKGGASPVVTSSEELVASFDPKTQELARLDQKKNFRYQEGNRRAQAETASLDQKTEVITLNGAARVWDEGGSTDADQIVLNQKSGDFAAAGKVKSIREPEKKSGGAVVSTSEVLRASADRMTSREKNGKIRYEGNAVLWQGANRIQGKRIDIDREKQELRASGDVFSQLKDKDAPAGKSSGFSIITAQELFYSEPEKLAHYTGGVFLRRENLQVKSRELRAYLAEENTEVTNEAPAGQLEKVFADGRVEIVETREQRTRQGWAERSEYYLADGKVFLEGGRPEMVDSVKGVPQRRARGRQLTWFANNDKLLVDGAENQPAVSTIRRK